MHAVVLPPPLPAVLRDGSPHPIDLMGVAVGGDVRPGAEWGRDAFVRLAEALPAAAGEGEAGAGHEAGVGEALALLVGGTLPTSPIVL